MDESGIDSVLTADEARLFKRYHDVTEIVIGRVNHSIERIIRMDRTENEDRLTDCGKNVYSARTDPVPLLMKRFGDWNVWRFQRGQSGVHFQSTEWS